ncbi:hypothetical protein SLEP1_g32523 [Rubroshorea leprosula]|uniref:BZIP domain-containing protein n=1 Tax=Rubroshorea leprosula TaxID=152421 RepID=A0AAV5KDK1_9ROSI|nr:hypothetical protein SLEP1_g32523 [Rubroshorea leprosula]
MANSKGSTNIRNLMYSGKHALLPPKSPYPSVSSTYTDYVPSNVIGSKAVQKPREGKARHQRTSSESLLIEEQPSWLDDLLNEPETPVRKGGHRRSSSDSFAYLDAANASTTDYAAQDEYRHKNMMSAPAWGSQDFDYCNHRDAQLASFYNDSKMMKQNRAWDTHSLLNARIHPSGLPSARETAHSSGIPSSGDNTVHHGSVSASSPQEAEVQPTAREKQDSAESVPRDPKASGKKDTSHAKPSASDTDTKRAKQQFAQRSRVRKLQYIAELERNVQALQAEGSEVSAELEFLNQQHLILSMENKALKQRLESLAQEQAIKYLEQEVLEREIGRLRALYQQQQQQNQQQQQQQQPSTTHRRTSSTDLDSQFANLSLKHKEASSGCDPVTGSLRI